MRFFLDYYKFFKFNIGATMDKDMSGEYLGGIFLERYFPIFFKDLRKDSVLT